MSANNKRKDEMISILGDSIRRGKAGLSSVPGLLMQIINESLWQERVIEATGQVASFKTFVQFVTTPPPEGLGTTILMLNRLCNDDRVALDCIDRVTKNPVGINQYSKGVDNVNTLLDRPDGNTRSYALRKLRTDAPELHARVLNKELTPHAAMLEAGFRKKTIQAPCTVDGVVKAIRERFTADEIQAIVKELRAHRE